MVVMRIKQAGRYGLFLVDHVSPGLIRDIKEVFTPENIALAQSVGHKDPDFFVYPIAPSGLLPKMFEDLYYDLMASEWGRIQCISLAKKSADFIKPRHCDMTDNKYNLVLSVGAGCILEMTRFKEKSYAYNKRTGTGFIDPKLEPEIVELFHIRADSGYAISGEAKEEWFHAICRVYGESIRVVITLK
jgi:hypothetical protein